MARLPIKASVLSRLFAMSGNLCAYPGCSQILYRDDGTGYVNVCHIHAANAGWARHDPSLDDEALRAIDNLILLCRNHHGEIDQEISPITADEIRGWKRRHEAKFTNLRSLFSPQIVDHIGDRQPAPPVNMGQLLVSHPDFFTTDDVQNIARDAQSYVGKIRNIPAPTTEFMVRVIRHGLRGADKERSGSSGITVDAEEVCQAFGLTPGQVTEFCSIMERYGVGYLMDDYPAEVRVGAVSDYLDWATLAECLASVGGDLDELLQVQDFTAFDTVES